MAASGIGSINYENERKEQMDVLEFGLEEAEQEAKRLNNDAKKIEGMANRLDELRR